MREPGGSRGSPTRPNVLLVMADQLVPFLTGAALERTGTRWDYEPAVDATTRYVR